MKKNTLIIVLLFTAFTFQLFGQKNYLSKENISYINKSDTDIYRRDRCKLDIYYPADIRNFATVIWFHGGGLTGGEKFIPDKLKNSGIAVVAVNYRLSPKATNPSYILDAAEAVAWVFNNISSFGGDTANIYVSGHSAGGYLTLMIGTDAEYLSQFGIKSERVKGLIPISGQTNTHYTIRAERNLPKDIPVIDNYAPINKVHRNMPPTLLITGDRNLEMLARYEENLHLKAIMESLDNDVRLCELQGFDHGSVVEPAYELLLNFVKKSK